VFSNDGDQEISPTLGVSGKVALALKRRDEDREKQNGDIKRGATQSNYFLQRFEDEAF
jgi:hypothetical protein